MEDQQVDAGSEYKLPASQFTAPSGKQFSAWDISGQNYKVGDRYTVQHDVTVRAVWTNAATPSIAPGASNSGGTDAITVPVSGDANTVSVSATVRGDTATVQKLTDKQLEKVIGEGVRTGAITIDASGLGTEINKVAIPTNTVKAITEAVNDPENDATGLTAVLTGGSLGFDGPALDAILEQTRGSTVTVCLADVGVAGLNDTQQAAVAELDVRKVLDAKVTSGSSSISDFRGGTATISTGCELNESERPGGVEVYHVADDGEVIRMASIFRDSRVTIAVSHNSNYVIAYDEELAAVCPQDGSCPLSDFSDLDPAAWYHDGIHYALENGMMNGTGNGTFAPEAETSRAMIVTMLWRMEGKPAYSGMPDYTDVEEDSWYTPAVRWASSEGIVNGYDESTFGPEDSVTREQLAAILYRCAQSKGQGFTGSWMFPLDYPDAADISEWADEAMHWMVMQGIIRGTGDGELNPQGKASRAEAATMLMRFAELDAQA